MRTLTLLQSHITHVEMIIDYYYYDYSMIIDHFKASSSRLSSCLEVVRNRARKLVQSRVLPEWKVRICSENNFPTAAGE